MLFYIRVYFRSEKWKKMNPCFDKKIIANDFANLHRSTRNCPGMTDWTKDVRQTIGESSVNQMQSLSLSDEPTDFERCDLLLLL